MSKLKNTLFATMVASITACGGNSEETTSPGLQAQNDDASNYSQTGNSQTGVPPTGDLHAGNAQAGVDLVLSDVSFVDGPKSVAGKTVAIEGSLVNNGTSAFNVADVSMALEYSATEDFARVYKTVVFDLRVTAGGGNSINFSARTNPASLPAGSYYTRLIVNPDWRLNFDNLPVDSDYSRTSRYLAESSYANNASEVFQFDVESQISCSEDGLEPNNDFGTVTVLQADGIVEGSLCEDDNDLYSVQIDGGQVVAVTLSYRSVNSFGNTRYLVLDPQHRRVEEGIAVSGENIRIKATESGTYYFALYGDRSEYNLSLKTGVSLFEDPTRPFFTAESVQGPYSSVYGPITLKKLSFDKQLLLREIVSCGVRTAIYNGEHAVGYSTPQYFAGTHVFRFVDSDTYLVDGTLYSGWTTENGDVSNAHWYTNLFPGWAEDIGNSSWRYWERDGLSYVECKFD